MLNFIENAVNNRSRFLFSVLMLIEESSEATNAFDFYS